MENRLVSEKTIWQRLSYPEFQVLEWIAEDAPVEQRRQDILQQLRQDYVNWLNHGYEEKLSEFTLAHLQKDYIIQGKKLYALQFVLEELIGWKKMAALEDVKVVEESLMYQLNLNEFFESDE